MGSDDTHFNVSLTPKMTPYCIQMGSDDTRFNVSLTPKMTPYWIQMGSDDTRFNVSLTLRDSHKTQPLKREESQSGIELRYFRLLSTYWSSEHLIKGQTSSLTKGNIVTCVQFRTLGLSGSRCLFFSSLSVFRGLPGK